MHILKNKYSTGVLFVIAFVTAFLIIRFPQYVFTYDNLGFYYYLPNLFIYKNFAHIDMPTLEQINDQYSLTYTFYQFSKVESGNIVNRFPIGLAILISPFFIIGHLIALLTAFPADGFSLPYQWAILSSGICYSFIGFYFARKLLRFYFDDKITAIILLVFFMGTNIFLFVALGNHFPHVYLFTLYILLIYFTILWHKKRKKKYAVWLGILLGLIVTARYSEVFAIFIPLFWGVYNRKTLEEKFVLLKCEYKQVIWLVVLGLLAVFPQILYWWSATGSPVYFGYDDAGSGLNLFSPRFAWVLFSYRKGWLLYSPLMALSLVGFYFLWKKQKEAFWPLLLYFFITFYLIASFSTLVSYGFRAFIHTYAILLLPFGYSISYLLQQKKWILIGCGVLILGISYINIFQAWQFRTGVLHGHSMTKAYYWRVFLKNSFELEDRELLLIERFYDGIDRFKNEERFNRQTLYYNSFEQPGGSVEENYIANEVSAGQYSFYLDENIEYFSHYEKKISSITKEYYAWFRVSMNIFPLDLPQESKIKIVVFMTYKGQIYKYKTVDISDDISHIEANKWYTISIDYLTPELRTKNDNFNVYIWNQGKNRAYIDELMIESFTVD